MKIIDKLKISDRLSDPMFEFVEQPEKLPYLSVMGLYYLYCDNLKEVYVFRVFVSKNKISREVDFANLMKKYGELATPDNHEFGYLYLYQIEGCEYNENKDSVVTTETYLNFLKQLNWKMSKKTFDYIKNNVISNLEFLKELECYIEHN